MRKLFSALPLLFLLVFGMVGQASAQTSWLPTFNASDKVYVAPGVDNSLRSAFESSTFASDLSQKAAVHNLNVIVVLTVAGNDAGSDSRQTGVVLVRKLWDAWTANSAFNKDRALVIVLSGDGHKLTSVGARAGDYLNRMGIVRNTMSDQNGPVIPVLRANLQSNPSAVPAGIVERINAIVSAKVGATAPVKSDGNATPVSPPSSTSSEGNSSMSLGTILLIVLGGGVLFFVIRAIFRSSSSSTSSSTDAGFQSRLDAERRARAARTSVPPTGGTSGTGTTPGVADPHGTAGGNGVNTALAVGGGVVAGAILTDQLRRRNEDDEADRGRRDDSTTTSTTSDSGYVAPVVAPSCSTPSTPSCSSSSGSSCSSSSGSSCGGGGSSCGGGGGGCGGGGS